MRLRAMRNIAVLIGATTGSVVFAGSFTWVGGVGNWSDAAMWGGTVPATGSDVNIDGGNAAASVVNFNTNASVANLTIDANDILQTVGTGRLLTVSSSIVNNGELRLRDAGGSVCDLRIAGVVSLSGSGTFWFDSDDDNRIIPGLNGNIDTLIVGPDQLMTTSALTMFDNSLISVLLENDGIVEANGGNIDLETGLKTNRNLMRAVNGGNLRFQSVTVNNTGAEIEAAADSTITYEGATLVGGDLTGAGTHFIDTSDATFDGTGEAVHISTEATVDMGATSGQALQLKGTIVNDGVIRLEDVGGSVTDIHIEGIVNLNGSGEIRLEGDDDNRIIPIVNGNVDTLIVGSDQAITTNDETTFDNSLISVLVTNNGLIEVNGGDMDIESAPKVNHGLMRARNGGNLRFQNVQVTNTGAEIQADTDSFVSLEGATIIGGTLRGPGNFDVGTSDAVFNGVLNPFTITSDATVNLVGASSRAVRLIGNIVNDGRIVISDTGSGLNDLHIEGPVTLGGSGEIVFDGTENNRIIAIVNGNTDILTIGAQQRLTTVNGTDLDSTVDVKFVNDGLIEANASALLISGQSPKVNNATVQAVNGGYLRLGAVEVLNAAGSIQADAGSTVSLAGPVIRGGTLSGAGTFVVETNDVQLLGNDDPVTIGNGTSIEMIGEGSRAVRMEGTIINDGEIDINDTGSGLNDVQVANVATLDGDGVIRFSGANNNRILAVINGNSDILQVGPNQLITTDADTSFDSHISARFDNAGTIEANGGLLDVDGNGPKANSGTLRAVGGGTLRLEAVMVNNSGDIEADAGSTLALANATVSGGVMVINGTLATSSSNTLDGVTLFPADGPGTMTVAGNMPVQTATNVIDLDLGGFTPDTQHDVINISGVARFGGTLRVRSVGGFVPTVGDRFTIAHYASLATGMTRFTNFESVGFPGFLTVRVDYGPASADLVVVRVGDINCDGAITVSDIAPLVIALTEPQNFDTLFPNCEIFDADINGDGVISVSDIGPFVALLTGG